MTPMIDLGAVMTLSSELTDLELNVVNTTYGDLYLDLTKGTPFFDLPQTIGPIPQTSSKAIVCKPIRSALEAEPGPQHFSIQYTNRNNSANICVVNVLMNVLNSFIKADCGSFLEFSAFKEVVVDDKTIRTVSLFLTISNCLEEETTTLITVDETLPNEAKVEVLRRSSEVKLENASLQAGEVIELRVKVTLADGLTNLSAEGRQKVATISFSNEQYPGSSVDVFFVPAQV